MNDDTLPESIAIAGAWGYIGNKFIDAASTLGVPTYVYDPGPVPADVDLSKIERIEDEETFYRAKADLFHLAVHPEHRQRAEEILFERAAHEPILILDEKPMAAPESPERCAHIVHAVERSGATVLYDFLQLYDTMTEQIIDFLSGYRDVRITELQVCQSKDREARHIPRNYKRMVTIQFQESVHCLAFVLYLLGKLKGNLASVFEEEMSIVGESDPYDPPNPDVYPHVVDGRCRYRLSIGETRVEGQTDFKANAEWSKRRVICGTGDGTPFRIDMDYLEGEKRLAINGVDQRCDPEGDSYQQVITTLMRWYRHVSAASLMQDVYPNPKFARLTYQLSGALWRSCRDQREIRFASLEDLLGFDAGFAAQLPSLPKY